jgi:hypothetical protein
MEPDKCVVTIARPCPNGTHAMIGVLLSPEPVPMDVFLRAKSIQLLLPRGHHARLALALRSVGLIV